MNDHGKTKEELIRELTELRRQIARQQPAEPEVLREEWHLRDFFENAAIGLHWVDAEGKILWANRAELDLLGYARDEYVGHHIAEFHADAKCIEDILRRLSAGETIRNYQAPLRCKDGSVRHVLISSSALFHDGKFVHTRCFTKDLTEQHLAERELRRQEQRLRLILDGVRDHAISMLDPVGRIITFNASAERIKGYSLAEVRGQYFEMFFTPEDRAAGLPETELQVARTTGRYEGEGWRQRKDGSRFYAAVSLSALHDSSGELVGFVKVTQDRTRYRELGEALERREAELRLIIDALPGLVAYMAPDQTYRLVNRAYEQWFGRPADEVLGKHLAEVLGADAYARLRPHVEAALAGQRTSFEAEVPYATGGPRWVRAEYVPDRDAAGRIHGFVGLVLDVTEAKRVAQRLADEARINETLYRIGTVLAAGFDLDRIFARLTDEATTLCRAQFGAFFYNVANDAGESYTLYTLAGVPRDKFAGFPMPRNTAIFAPTFAGEGVVRSDDITQDARYGKNPPYHGMPAGHLAVRSYLAVPVVSRTGAVHGGLFFGHADAGVFTEKDERMLVAVAAQAAVAIDNARLYQAEAAARADAERERARLRQILDAMPAMVLLLRGPELRIEFLSPTTVAALGKPLEQTLGRPIAEITPNAPDSVAAMHRAYASGEAVHRVETPTPVDTPQGRETRYFTSVYEPMRDADGAVSGLLILSNDVTDQVSARQTIATTEGKFRRIFESNMIGFVFTAADGRVLDANDYFLAMLGYRRGDVEAGRLRWDTLTPAEHAAAGARAVELLRATGVCPPFETEYVHKDGRRVPVVLGSAALPTRDGDAEFVTFVLELTERKALEAERERLLEAAKASEVQFRTLADAIPVLAWYAEPDGHIPWYNRRWHEYTGLPLAEQEGWKWQRVHDPADVDRVTAKWKSSLATGEPFEDTFRLRGQDGVYRWFLTRVEPLRDPGGRIVRWFGTNVDVDRQKRATETLHSVVEASTVLASSLDYRATLAAVARLAVPQISDWCAVEILDDAGEPQQLAVAHVDPAKVALAHELRRRYPPDPDARHGVPEVLRSGRSELLREIPAELLEAAARDADHRQILEELGLRSAMLVPITAQGRTFGAISFVSAESGRRYDAQDLALAEDLARRAAVAIDNARLFEMTQRERLRAEEANRAKDEFLSVASHELRTPLNAILGWSRMLRGGSLPEAKRDRALETIERNARVQVQLVEDILDVSRIITGKLRLALAPLEPAQVVEAAVEVVRPAADAKGLRLQVLLDPDVGTVNGDAGRLQQVLWNLLANAVKFTPKGGRVYVRLQREDSHVEIVVGDNGAGIAPSFLSQVFQPFRQHDSTITRSHGGLGLGLAIVKHLVELHGGTITAHSDGPGKGATFVVRIPVAPLRSMSLAPLRDAHAPAVRPGAPLRCPPELEGLRVLICEDEPDARDLIESILTECKATVVSAGSVSEAMDRFREAVPDVLVSDIGMPDASGYELIRHIRALPPDQGGRIPAVALTAYASMNDRTRALMEGFTAHAAKPTEPQELVAVIAALVNRHVRQ